jgi:hypothetical protein
MKHWEVLRGLRPLAATLALISATPAFAQEPTPMRVAVVPGVAVNLDAARVDALSQDMADALSTELVVDAIGGLEVRRKLPADGLPPDCVASPTCITDVAKRLNVEQLLFVVMVDTGGSGAVQIDTTWVDVATSKSASRPAIDIALLAEAKARFAASARVLLPDAAVRAKPKAGGGIEGKMTDAVPRHFTTASYITAGVAIAGLGLGIGFGVRTKGLYDDCDQPTAPCNSSDEDKIRTSALIADIGYLAAVGGAVATVILYATSGSGSRLVVSPNAEGGGGVSYVGRF